MGAKAYAFSRPGITVEKGTKTANPITAFKPRIKEHTARPSVSRYTERN